MDQMTKMSSNIDIEWTPENEIKLFYAMRGHKPVGVAKNFHMISILDEFVRLTDKEMSSKVIWNRLDTMYDMDTLHENEDMPFPNTNTCFTIEDNPEFTELIEKRKANQLNKSDKDIEIKEELVSNVSTTTTNTPTVTKTGNKTKTQETNKSQSKVKSEIDKNAKSDRKEDSTKHSDKSEEIEDKWIRSKKTVANKSGADLRSSTTSSTKKRK
ncbi:MRG/MORF4L-binding protein-like [Oppia nitens]|uniref:MRG/MORF4L-binding protein-like n=1 Tax=Oppia nitens TaxID=1686743 RepID=UPI0023DCE575|nr:MRG/MORF4L-binding protein-like [Oppia nitens]